MKDETKHETKIRAREETAKIVRDAAAKHGHQMTHTEARERVDRAVTRGDRIRDNRNR